MSSKHDPECETLAEHFLADELYTKGATAYRHEQRVWFLADAIQDAVDEWLDGHPPDQPVEELS